MQTLAPRADFPFLVVGKLALAAGLVEPALEIEPHQVVRAGKDEAVETVAAVRVIRGKGVVGAAQFGILLRVLGGKFLQLGDDLVRGVGLETAVHLHEVAEDIRDADVVETVGKVHSDRSGTAEHVEKSFALRNEPVKVGEQVILATCIREW